MKIDIPSYVWWSVGINPDDPADWALMSSVAEQVYLEWIEK